MENEKLVARGIFILTQLEGNKMVSNFVSQAFFKLKQF